jgi:carbamoyltransferase
MGTDVDLLVVGNAVLHKQDQDQNLRVNYKDDFEMD